jgi:hypothetical protein
MLSKCILFCLILVSTLNSCSSSSKEIVAIKYFDVPDFFDKEVGTLSSKNAQVSKVLSSNGETSTLVINPKSWKKELSVFSSIDLNKSSYIGKYQVDTIASDRRLNITYIALDDNVPVQDLSYAVSDKQVLWIEVNKEDKSMILSTDLHLRYVPDSGYSVSGYQQIGALDPNEYSVSAEFVQN